MEEILRRQDDKKIEDLTSRFDRHLEIYAQNGKELAGVKVEVSGMRDDIRIVGETLKSGYVTIDQFSPVKMLVYGLVGLILTAVVTAGLTYVIMQNNSQSNSDMMQKAVKTAIDNYNLTLTK